MVIRKKNNITTLFLLAVIIRSFILIMAVLIDSQISSFLLVDDLKFNDFANYYLQNSTSIIDETAYNYASINIGGVTSSYLWFWFIAIVTKIFGTTMALRVFNILISSLSVFIIYKLTLLIGNKEKTAYRSAVLYSFLPYSMIFSIFILKDTLLAFLFLILIYLMIKTFKEKKVKPTTLFLMLLIGTSIYYMRSGLIETLVVIVLLFILIHLIFVKKSYFVASLFIFSILALLYIEITNNILDKIDTYLSYGRENTNISFVRIDSISEIYKFPLTYMFALLQPFSLFHKTNTWLGIISYLNISMIPIAVGNVLYLLFHKKNNNYFYYGILILYSGTIILSLGIFRHYFFLLPFSIIFYSSYVTDVSKKLYVYILSICMIFMLVIMYVFIT